jgi:hypothetical protein
LSALKLAWAGTSRINPLSSLRNGCHMH